MTVSNLRGQTHEDFAFVRFAGVSVCLMKENLPQCLPSGHRSRPAPRLLWATKYRTPVSLLSAHSAALALVTSHWLIFILRALFRYLQNPFAQGRRMRNR